MLINQKTQSRVEQYIAIAQKEAHSPDTHALKNPRITQKHSLKCYAFLKKNKTKKGNTYCLKFITNHGKL